MLGQVHHGLHHVFDHQHRHARRGYRAHDWNHLGDFPRIQPSQHFVEQQQLGLGGQRARQFQPFATGHGQVGGGLVELRGQIDALGHRCGHDQRLRAARLVQMHTHRDVLAHRLRRKRLHDLECARQTGTRIGVGWQPRDVAAVELNPPAVQLQKTRHQCKQGGLAGAVGTDQGRQAAGGYLQAYVLHRLQATEAARHAGYGHQRGGHGDLPFQNMCTLRPTPPNPRGTNTMVSTSTLP